MRNAGVLLPISSLPSNHGIGDFGTYAYEFILNLKKIGFSSWQVLPLNPLGYGNSPYQPYGSKPFDEIYISLDLLFKHKLIDTKPNNYNEDSLSVDYENVRLFKNQILRSAYYNYLKTKKRGFRIWVNKNPWVYNYAVFITFKKHNQLVQWHYWPNEFKNWIFDKKLDLTPYIDEINYQMWLQFVAYTQWNSLHKYAKKHGIKLIGDMPIYVGIDSVDVWENPAAFLLDEKYEPTFIAGVPPDYFSKTGQRWGNPLYDWEYLKITDFDFWKERLGYNLTLFDLIRVDHFRAFDTYWKIPVSCQTAIEGEWVEAPGYQLFDELYKTFPNMKIIAEDLGDLRKEVLLLRDHYSLPGMEIVQFTYNPYSNKHEELNNNRIIYPGTHDNQTMKGWLAEKDNDFIANTIKDLNDQGFAEYDNIFDKFIAYTLNSTANMAIIPLQDLLHLGDETRLNTPGTIGSPNWKWKLVDFAAFKDKTSLLKNMLEKYTRK